jgi:hypothetical protein
VTPREKETASRNRLNGGTELWSSKRLFSSSIDVIMLPQPNPQNAMSCVTCKLL